MESNVQASTFIATMEKNNNLIWSFGLFIGSVSFLNYVKVVTKDPSRDRKVKNAQLAELVTSKRTSGDTMIKTEMYSRISSFFGERKFKTMTEGSFVVVVGLGGVGSHAANMLVRSGVTNIRVIDFDQVTLSSLNRHAMATLADVGKPKAEVMKRRLQEVAPWCQVDAVVEMFKGAEAERLLQGAPTYVLDCIDDVTTKAELISYCLKNGIRVLTSMGAGGKADPTRLRVSPLSDCMNDPLASKIKWKLKKFGVSPEEVMSVFSIEKPAVDLLPLDEEQAAAPQEYGTMDYLRVRVMPVLGTSPAIFGQALASKVLCTLAEQEYAGEVCERMSKSLKHKLLQTMRAIEKRRFGTSDEVDMDDDDIEWLVAQAWGSRCVVTGRRFGGHAPLVIMRWNRSRPPTLDNLVLMTKNFADKIETEEKEKEEKEAAAMKSGGTTKMDTPRCLDAEIVRKIETRLQWARAVIGSDKATSQSTEGAAFTSLKSWMVTIATACICYGMGYTAAVARAWTLGVEL